MRVRHLAPAIAALLLGCVPVNHAVPVMPTSEADPYWEGPRLIRRGEVALVWSNLSGKDLPAEDLVCDYLLEKHIELDKALNRPRPFEGDTCSGANQFVVRDRVRETMPSLLSLKEQLRAEPAFRVRLRKYVSNYDFSLGGYRAEIGDGDRIPFYSSASALFFSNREPTVQLSNGSVLAKTLVPESMARKIEGQFGTYLVFDMVVHPTGVVTDIAGSIVNVQIVRFRAFEERTGLQVAQVDLHALPAQGMAPSTGAQ